MELSAKSLKKFKNDYNIPFTCIDDMSFSSMLNEYASVVADAVFIEDGVSFINTGTIEIEKAKEIYNKLLSVKRNLVLLENADSIIFDCINDFANFISDWIKGKYDTNVAEAYNELLSFTTLSNRHGHAQEIAKHDIPNADIYKQTTGIGQKFISVDIKQAGFQALSWFDDRFFNSMEWNEFVYHLFDVYKTTVSEYKRLTSLYGNIIIDYIVNSKHIRQVIIGKTNPKKIVSIEKHIMNIAFDKILKAVPNATPVSLCTDEIIFKYSDELYEYFSCHPISPIVDDITFHVCSFTLNFINIKQKIQKQEKTFTNSIYCAVIKRRIDSPMYSVKCCPAALRYAVNALIKNKMKPITCNDSDFFKIKNNELVYSLNGTLECNYI